MWMTFNTNVRVFRGSEPMGVSMLENVLNVSFRPFNQLSMTSYTHCDCENDIRGKLHWELIPLTCSQHSSTLPLFMFPDFKSFHYIQYILSGFWFLFSLLTLVLLLLITVFFGPVFPNLLGLLPGHGSGNSLSHPLHVVEFTCHQGSYRIDWCVSLNHWSTVWTLSYILEMTC